MNFSTFGRHVTLDAWGVDFHILNNLHQLENHMKIAANACKATVLSVQAQKFTPQGVTVLVMLSESHLSIHTYPERGFAALDCYTCGHSVNPMVAIEYMVTILKPLEIYSKVLRRGMGRLEVLASSSLDIEAELITNL